MDLGDADVIGCVKAVEGIVDVRSRRVVVIMVQLIMRKNPMMHVRRRWAAGRRADESETIIGTLNKRDPLQRFAL
jgi:hypothetical protein